MALSTIFQYLKLVPGVVKAGGGRIVAFFTSSWYSYFGMFAFVIYDHLNTLFSLKFTETFVDVGTKLGKADAIIAENLTYLATNASGIGYITTLIQVFVAFFTVLWFVRTVGTILRFFWSDMIPQFITYGIGVLLWFLSVVYVTGSFPLATLELFLKIPEIISLDAFLDLGFDGFGPFSEPSNLSNTSNSSI